MDSKANSSVGLTKVVLYKHGIGYFERRGKVTGPCKIDLVCEASEIDDMLKSLLALTDSGRIDAITYDSSKTLESRLAEFGFDILSTDGLSGLLSQMKGIPVTVSVSGESISGRVLGLDDTELVVNDSILREKQLTLYTEASSFKRISLSSISAIHVEDEMMATELKQQLELLFQNAKKKDRKALAVSLSEPGEHSIFIAYSIPSPIWKTSYRLLMDESRVMLQGMAIVDNIQEEDWIDVQIVLVSASPVSFIQPLYEPVLPKRPRIAAQGNQSSGPVLTERAQKREEQRAAKARNVMPMSAPAPGALAGAGGAAMDSWGEADAVGMFGQAMPANAAMFAEAAQPLDVESSEKGELFEYRVNKPVTVPRNSSALIPIVQQDIDGERISLYNETKNQKFPYAAIRFINNTGLTLESGPVTIMEGDLYAGEALLDTVKPDDKRYLLYAIDQACPVVIRQKSISRPYWRARAIGGAVYVDYKLCNEKCYELENLSNQKKLVYVEHRYSDQWKLVSDEVPAETTQNFYRFKVELAAKKNSSLTVAEESDTYMQIWIGEPGNLDIKRMEWLCAQNFVNDEFIRFVKLLIEKNNEMRSLHERLALEQQMLNQYTEDQARARENLKTLGANNERYRKIIDAAEDHIAATRTKLQNLQAEMMQKQQQYRELAQTNLVSTLDDVAKKKK